MTQSDIDDEDSEDEGDPYRCSRAKVVEDEHTASLAANPNPVSVLSNPLAVVSPLPAPHADHPGEQLAEEDFFATIDSASSFSSFSSSAPASLSSSLSFTSPSGASSVTPETESGSVVCASQGQIEGQSDDASILVDSRAAVPSASIDHDSPFPPSS